MGKPLITDAAMRGMYQTMQRIRTAKQDAAATPNLSRGDRARLQLEPEALLAALLSQVHRRDTVLTQGNHPLLPTALAESFSNGVTPLVETCEGNAEEIAAIAAGMALRIAQKAGSPAQAAAPHEAPPRPVVVALIHDLPAMTGVLQIIQRRDLAVLIVAGGEPESRADAQRRLLSTKVPVMPVDSTDAVAVCRVTQECMLRARSGWGGAVIHATRMPGSGDSLLMLAQHLEKRGRVP